MFIEITNQHIYDKIVSMEENNQKQHAEIIKHQTRTNGKVKLNKWISSTALTLCLVVIGFFVKK